QRNIDVVDWHTLAVEAINKIIPLLTRTAIRVSIYKHIWRRQTLNGVGTGIRRGDNALFKILFVYQRLTNMGAGIGAEFAVIAALFASLLCRCLIMLGRQVGRPGLTMNPGQ